MDLSHTIAVGLAFAVVAYTIEKAIRYPKFEGWFDISLYIGAYVLFIALAYMVYS